MIWKKNEIKVLEENQHLSTPELVGLLDRTHDAIQQKRNKLGLQWNGNLKWEDWEIDLLAKNRFLSHEEISKRILPHRTASAIKDRRTRLGLSHMVRCVSCGAEIVKNNQHDICRECLKDHNYHNHSMLGKYRQYKHGASRRALIWDLTVQEFASFWHADCHYCGEQIDGVGIDRKDNKLGYTTDNAVPCCITCNEMKLDHAPDDWIAHMRKIINHLGVSYE